MSLGPGPTTLAMLGRKYGHLTVLQIVGQGRGSVGYRILAKCDCGRTSVHQAHHVRSRVNQCILCGRAASAMSGRVARSVRLPSGDTVAMVAARNGLPLDTVYGRWRRGWPERDLGKPLYPGGRPRGFAQRVRPPVTLEAP